MIVKLLTLLLGLISAFFGGLIHLPDEDNELRKLQIGLNEMSWFPALLGGLAVWLGWKGKPRSWFGMLAGAFGLGASLWPFVQYTAAVEDMESAMRAGLGKDYQTIIPEKVKQHLPSSRWSLSNTLGAREFMSQAHITRGLVYTAPGGVALTLDVYQPTTSPIIGASYPAIIAIQGGGWRRDDQNFWFEPHNHYLANQGYVVFDVKHRLSQAARWPAQLEDIQAAVRWVKNCAGEYRVDTQGIAVLGRSSGAHLALMAGMRANDLAARVRAVVSIYAPTDLQFSDLPSTSPIIQLMGGVYQDMPAAYADASPIEFVRHNLPPILIVEGMKDRVVPYHHGDKLVTRLSLTNTPHVLLRLPWSRHGFDALLSGLGGQLTQYYIDHFLAWSLYGDHPHA